MAWLLKVLLVVGMLLLVNGGWIHAKALLAQALIRQAWQQALSVGEPAKPWPWADTWPVGRLQISRYDVDLYTLEGLGGNALAFGPGQLTVKSVSAQPNSYVIAGHRDTHFTFMQQLQLGDRLQFTDQHGESREFRIVDLQVEDSRYQQLSLADGQQQMLLVTCYPFDAIDAGGPLRYVATAVAEPQTLEM